MPRLDADIEHLLRRAGFGASATDVQTFASMSRSAVLSYLVDYEGRPDDVDARIGRPDHVQVSTQYLFTPDIRIEDARQRWLFRMIHSKRPLQEKMSLFWHNHFATSYSKIAGLISSVQATKMMALKPGVLRGPQGQIELFRQYALGNFRDLLLQVARDPAMLVWLDGQSNVKGAPQENFGREIMELFTLGVGHYTESDVYAAARVFTGWNMGESDGNEYDDPNGYYEFVFNPSEHDTGAKTFSFPIYSNGSRTIPERSESAGMQDGIDFITALATHPETARRLARKFWQFFVSDLYPADPGFVDSTAAVYLQNGTEIRPVIRHILSSSWFTDRSTMFTRYSWPAEFVARAIKEVGWQGFSLEQVLTPMANMGMQLYEPPNVGGWPTAAAWFSTATMMARSNFAAVLAANQREHLAVAMRPSGRTPQALLTAVLDRVRSAPLDNAPQRALESYVLAEDAWSGRDDQIQTRASGLARLLVGSSEYQLV